ncbi:30S ribosomal protein S2 [Candidatus Zinderia endosymbiont of Aphrophora alni]|uniref:30S ribosomal protein S2 n=1 Tax=Candidatus Zinderia endosymbiont of Aphrophora alni TaxID=3077951 RepID=UPI0030D055A2
MITIKKMIDAKVHFGHQTRFWNPKMSKFIFGHKNKIHIINLEKTLYLYNKAINFVKKLSKNKKTILFVCTKRQARKIIFKEALKSKSPYINQRWLGGTLTNFKTIKVSIDHLIKLENTFKNFNEIKKKEILLYNRKKNKLKKNFEGLKKMKFLPDALFIIDIGYHKNAVIEAKKLNIPIIALVDTNHNPDNIDYIIPGNDDSIKSIKLFSKGITNAILEGKALNIKNNLKFKF